MFELLSIFVHLLSIEAVKISTAGLLLISKQ